MKDYTGYFPTLKEKLLHDGKTVFNNQLEGFEGFEININNDTDTETEELILTDALIMNSTNPLNEYKEDRKIRVWKDVSLKRGDKINIISDNIKYLVISKIDNDGLTKFGKIREINYELKWKNDKGLEYTEEAVIHDIRDLNVDYGNGKHVDLTSDSRIIYIQDNENSSNIELNQRFIIDKKAFKVTDINTVNLKGLIVLNLEAEGLEVNDNVVDDIADDITHVYEIQVPDTIELQNGNTLQLNPVVYKDGDIEVAELTYLSGDELIATISNEGLITGVIIGATTITVGLKDSDITKVITLNVVATASDNITVEITGDKNVKKGILENYTIKKYNNGVEIPQTYRMVILDGEDLIEFTEVDGNTFTIKGINTGDVRIEFTDEATSDLTFADIKITDLW